MRPRPAADPLEPFRPDVHGPWDTPAACHLLRRAGFAPSIGEIRTALDRGPSETVRVLVEGDAEESRAASEMEEIRSYVRRSEGLDAVRGWWLRRMARTTRPLHARMAVFWHGHFATSNEKVRSAPMMLAQVETIEARGMGPFEDLLLAMSQDPAMIVWLDGASNIKGRPNENYARELFELFALGVGNYTERDVKEAARAFTGWHQREGRFRFFPRDHDSSVKTVLGATGDLGGEDVVRLAVGHPACSRFLASKILAEFVTPRPDGELVEAFAACLRENGMHVGRSLSVLLSSRAMFDPAHRRSRIKSPVEFVVGICRSLETKAPARVLVDSVNQMGQRLLEPPSVKGWPGHRSWINSSTALLRLNAVRRLTDPDGNGMLSTGELRSRHGLATPDGVVAFCEKVSLDGVLPSGASSWFEEAGAVRRGGDLDALLRGTLRVLMSTPEYQCA